MYMNVADTFSLDMAVIPFIVFHTSAHYNNLRTTVIRLTEVLISFPHASEAV